MYTSLKKMRQLSAIAHIDIVIESLFLLIPMSDNRTRLNMMLTCHQWAEIGQQHLDYEAKNARGLLHIMAMGDEENVRKVIERNPSLMNVEKDFGLIFGAPNIVRLLILKGIEINDHWMIQYLIGLTASMGYTDAHERVT